MRIYIGFADYAPDGNHWYATQHGLDLDVPVGSGSTPRAAVEDLLWHHLDIEDVAAEACELVIEG